MGCDIHLYVEKRAKKGTDEYDDPDIWEHVPGCKWYESAEHCAEAVESYRKRGEEPSERHLNPSPLPCFDPGRNYDLFAMLANVRNGYGFAGCDTGDGFVPILGRENPQRGLPQDASDFVKARAYEWGEDGHSHSYLTVAELKAYDWDQETAHRGYVNAREYIEYKEKGSPDSYCGGVSGSGVIIVSNADMEAHIAAVAALKQQEQTGGAFDIDKPAPDLALIDPKIGRWTQVEWKQKYRDSVSHFLAHILPELEKLGPPEDVRICFWFDN
jgi:hypothetical protein